MLLLSLTQKQSLVHDYLLVHDDVLKEVLQKTSYAVCTGPVVKGIELFENWRKEKCGDYVGDMLWIHCNAHMVPAMDTAVTEALKAVEDIMGLKDRIMFVGSSIKHFFPLVLLVW